jgi:hypothetical protein
LLVNQTTQENHMTVIKEAVATIREQRNKLDQVLKLLGEIEPDTSTSASVSQVTEPTVATTGKKKYRFSAESRRRMSEAQKKRYAIARRRSGNLITGLTETTSANTTSKAIRPYHRVRQHWTQTPEGKKKLASMSRKMWKTRRAAF